MSKNIALNNFYPFMRRCVLAICDLNLEFRQKSIVFKLKN